jgi:LmbE family N-acetylglucosaminyl deacetylase
MPYTLVTFHAHPDDEALLTSGTLARAAAEGHRVVLVVATDGDLGLSSRDFTADGDLGGTRLTELQTSARALGIARVEYLGYGDSGMTGEIPADLPGRQRFCRADPQEAAERLARILTEESADVLTSYDPRGGYGHRDHIRVHEVGALAAELAGTPRVLQATVPRDLLVHAINLVARFYRFPPDFDIDSYRRAYSARDEINYRISVWKHARAKRASMRAHASQAVADGGDRTLAMMLKIPRPVYDLVFGHEWFVEAGYGGPVRHDIFEGLEATEA